MKRRAKPARPVTLAPSDYQPSQAEIREEFTLPVQGKDVREKMRSLAEMVLAPVKITRKNPKSKRKTSP